MQSKLILLLTSLAFSFATTAQFKKGSLVPGLTIGTGSFSSGTTNYTFPDAEGYKASSSNFSLSLSPSFGKFFSDQVMAGFSFTLNSTWQKADNKSLRDTTFSSGKAANTDLGLGLFLRYYLQTGRPINPFLQVFANGGTGFGSTSGFLYGSDVSGAYRESYEGKTTGRFFMNTGVNAGITKMLGAQVALEAFVGYIYSFTKHETRTISFRDYSSAVNADLTEEFEPAQRYNGGGISFGLGFQVFLEKRRK